MDAQASSASVFREALRLLIYVAWSDGDVSPEEYDFLLVMAKRRGLPADEMKELEAAVRNPKCAVHPNVLALKPLRSEILSEVQSLIVADGHVAEAEVAMLHRVAALLS